VPRKLILSLNGWVCWFHPIQRPLDGLIAYILLHTENHGCARGFKPSARLRRTLQQLTRQSWRCQLRGCIVEPKAQWLGFGPTEGDVILFLTQLASVPARASVSHPCSPFQLGSPPGASASPSESAS
jgi:hypothetical protein